MISPAIKVTLFHASLENKELIIVAPIAPAKAIPVSFVTVVVFVVSSKTVLLASHVLLKLFEKVSVWKPIYNPKAIKAKSAINLAEVNTN